MKKLLLLIVGTIATLTTKSQTSVYHPFPDSNAVWCSSSWAAADPTLCISTETSYELSGDSMINGIVYNRLLEHTVTELWTNCSYIFQTYIDSSLLFMRQDTVLKTVWLYNISNDTVLYNFNLNIGDTLTASKVYWGGDGHVYIVTSIDSVNISGNWRKRYNFSSSCAGFPLDTSLIEGIGSTSGLLSSPSCFEVSIRFAGFSQNNITVYPDSGATCNAILLSVNSILSNYEVSIYPNPFSILTTIDFSQEQKNATIRITNLLGKEIKTIDFTGKQLTLDKGEMRNGIYFVQITDDNKNVVNKKIIIQ